MGPRALLVIDRRPDSPATLLVMLTGVGLTLATLLRAIRIVAHARDHVLDFLGEPAILISALLLVARVLGLLAATLAVLLLAVLLGAVVVALPELLLSVLLGASVTTLPGVLVTALLASLLPTSSTVLVGAAGLLSPIPGGLLLLLSSSLSVSRTLLRSPSSIFPAVAQVAWGLVARLRTLLLVALRSAPSLTVALLGLALSALAAPLTTWLLLTCTLSVLRLALRAPARRLSTLLVVVGVVVPLLAAVRSPLLVAIRIPLLAVAAALLGIGVALLVTVVGSSLPSIVVPALVATATALVLAATVLRVPAVATLPLLGARPLAPAIALGSIGPTRGPMLVLCASLVALLDLAALVLALLGLVILGLCLVVESGSLRRSRVGWGVGVHE